MANTDRRIVTGHDANGKPIVASDDVMVRNRGKLAVLRTGISEPEWFRSRDDDAATTDVCYRRYLTRCRAFRQGQLTEPAADARPRDGDHSSCP
jgi:hypothetical protein